MAAPLEAQIHQLRLLPFSQACEGLTRVVRDLALSQAKNVELRIEGGEIELDRYIVEGLREPLLHLLRNAVDHGIEPPAERDRAGKPPRATLTIAAVAVGELVEVSVSDDGGGLDRHAIRAALRARGEEEGGEGWERVIFLPGFSTAARVSAVSGRGVGLDIVRTAAERMNGSVSVESGPLGTRFVLALPVTLSTRRVLFVRAGTELFALPSAAVEVLLRVRPSDVKSVADKVVVLHAGSPVPSAELGALLGVASVDRDPSAPLLAVVLRADGLRAALMVDELLSEQDMILKPLGPRVQALEHVSSGVLLATGELALVLKPATLLASALARASTVAEAPRGKPSKPIKRLLLADDSLTTRTLERSILEAAGYEVMVAVDGANAWHLLQEHGADLLLSDVEMPNMDGLTLAETVRSSKRFRDLPVVLLTSRDSPEDRARGLRAGANAYLVKSAFDQTKLLRAIEQLL